MIGNLVLLIVILACIITAGVFITRAWWKNHHGGFWSLLIPWWIRRFTHKKQKTAVQKAESFLQWSFIITWLSVGLVIFLIVGYLTVAGETASKTGGAASMILLIVAICSIVAQGILAAVGAEYLRESSENKEAFTQAVIGACISLGSAGMLFLYQIVRAIQKKQQQKKHAKAQVEWAMLNANRGPKVVYVRGAGQSQAVASKKPKPVKESRRARRAARAGNSNSILNQGRVVDQTDDPFANTSHDLFN